MSIEFLLVGSGWRAEYFIRLAKKLPERFSISAIVTTSKEKAQLYAGQGFTCAETIEEGMNAGHPEFAVISVNHKVIHRVSLQVMEYGLPVLSETPPASTYADLIALYQAIPPGGRYQVAEQYQFRPDHQARLACIKRGIIGRPVQALVSLTNNYHAISLLRTYLSESGDTAVIRAQRFSVPGKPGFEREGVPKVCDIRMYEQTVATVQFGERYGIYSFEADQHRSFIRSCQIKIKGDQGELNNQEVRYFKGTEPIFSTLSRRNKGENENMEGCGLKGILLNDIWVYQNPYPDGFLSDDEIAAAQCLDKMSVYCQGGSGFYGIEEAAQDYYLTLLLEEAVKTGNPISAKEQSWTRALKNI